MNIDTVIENISICRPELIREIKNTYQCSDESAKGYLKFYGELVLDFKSHFPKSKDINILRAPGRVNLIGEHTDYNALPVLPIAIEKNIIVIFAVNNDSTVRIYNHDPKFEYREFKVNNETDPYETGDWGNYVKAGIFWLPVENKKGFNALIYGNIPFASGLSSSSALVVASALTFIKSNEIQIDGLELAENLSKAEQYVGTMGGGMDQAISLLGKEGSALNIDFHPLLVTPVKMPNDVCFVVINSMIKAPKTESARLKYNRRPIECRIVTAFINKFVNEKYSTNIDFKFIGDLKKKFPGFNSEVVKYILESVLNQERYSSNEIVSLLGFDAEDFKNKYLKLKDGTFFPEPEDGFKLQQRFKYVIEESFRVDEAVNALTNDDSARFGELMKESHKGARELYEISCHELDYLVDNALLNGALGARLTGAGFGGCMISLLKAEDAQFFIDKMRILYFRDYLPFKQPNLAKYEINIAEKIFICKPCRGAGFLFE